MPFDMTGEYDTVTSCPFDITSVVPTLGFSTADLNTFITFFPRLLSLADLSINESNFLPNTLASVNLDTPVRIIMPLESTRDRFAEDKGDIWLCKKLSRVSELMPANIAP